MENINPMTTLQSIGNYRIECVLGSGGMADVYLATHTLLNKKFAIKVMKPELGVRDPMMAKRFVREAQLAQKVDHPNIVKVYDVGNDPTTGLLFIVMEYVEGQTLFDYSQGKHLPSQRIREIAYEMTKALVELHRMGIVHRDIKPSNIMLCSDGSIKLMDLGIAKAMHNGNEGELTLTVDQAVLGTPAFCSPEQCRDAKSVDIRSDIYCLGTSLYAIATGKVPYDGTTAVEIILKVLEEKPTPLAEIRPDLDADLIHLIEHMMEKSPDKRPQTPQDLLLMLVSRKSNHKRLKKIDVAILVVGLLLTLMIIGKVLFARFSQNEPEVLVNAENSTPVVTASQNPPNTPAEKEEKAEPQKVTSISQNTMESNAGTAATAPSTDSGVNPSQLSPDVSQMTNSSSEEAVLKPSQGNNVDHEGEKHTANNRVMPYMIVDLLTGFVRFSDVPPDVSNDICRTRELWLRHIPAGTFDMGSPHDELERREDETSHKVILTKDFYIGIFEYTQRQWETVMGSNPAKHQGEARPVESVSYQMIRGTDEGAGWPERGHVVDSMSFLGKLRAKCGLRIDLPTEAQWEYACRAKTSTAFGSGRDLFPDNGYAGLYDLGRFEFYRQRDNRGGYQEHTKVGCYQPNDWGLYDMHGNVWEWCLDWKGMYPNTTVTDPKGAMMGEYRVIRGGAWNNKVNECRSAFRGGNEPKSNYYGIGFRVVCPTTCSLSVINGIGGRITTVGMKMTAAATVPDGFVFREWKASGLTLSKESQMVNPLVFEMPNGDVQLIAFFSPKKIRSQKKNIEKFFSRHITLEERLADVEEKLASENSQTKIDEREISEKIPILATDRSYVLEHFNEFKCLVHHAQRYRLKEQIKINQRAKNVDKSKFNPEATKKLQQSVEKYLKRVKGTNDYTQKDIQFSEGLLRQLKTGRIDPNVEIVDYSKTPNKSRPLLLVLLSNRFYKRDLLLKELLNLGADANLLLKKQGMSLFSQEQEWILTNGGIDRLENQLLNHLISGMHYQKLVSELILVNHDVREVDKQGNTALHYAARHGLFDIAALLIASGADMNAWNNDVETPLFEAEKSCQHVIKNLLLNLGADATIKNHDGKKASDFQEYGHFIKSAVDGDVQKLQSYLKTGYSPNTIIPSYGKTLLWHACEMNNLEVAELLLKYKADTEAKGQGTSITPLGVIVSRGFLANRLPMFSLLIKNGANPNVWIRFIGQMPDRPEFLLDAIMRDTPIAYDSVAGETRLSYLKVLLSTGKAKCCTPYGYRSIFEHRDKRMTNTYLEYQKKYDEDEPVVPIAISCGVSDEVISDLIKKKANVNIPVKFDALGSAYKKQVTEKKLNIVTALIIAVQMYQADMVRLLLQNHADQYWTNESGKGVQDIETSRKIKELLKK